MTAATDTAPSLAERLEAARAAEAGPRQRVAELRAALQAAEERRDWAEVTRLEGELRPAEEALAFASAVVTALDAQAAAIERERQEREAARVKAQQVAEAQTVIAQALEDEQLARGQLAEIVDRGFEYLRAAQHVFVKEAEEAERAVAAAQQKAINARVTAGELASPHQAPGANVASVLRERDAVVRELVKWTGPPEAPATRQQIAVTSAPSPDARAAVQRSPW
jgi:hypothetical protein